MLLLSLKNDWQPPLFESGRCENSFCGLQNLQKALLFITKDLNGPIGFKQFNGGKTSYLSKYQNEKKQKTKRCSGLLYIILYL